MCTAISDRTGMHIFGRTLDLEYSLNEEVVITPRRFTFNFLHQPSSKEHCAMIGTAHVAFGMPLYYDAVNERGLCAAALSFPGFCEYKRPKRDMHNIASFELVPWVLSRAENIEEVRRLLANSNITDESIDASLPATPLHWLFADTSSSVTVESTRQGLKIHDNPRGVLTNSPDFEEQLINLERYLHIIERDERLCSLHSRGLEGFGLPGDYSSGSRFARAIYVKSRSQPPKTADEAISRHFHIFDCVSQTRGITLGKNRAPVSTVYTSAIDTEKLEYFFTTYENRRVRCVKLDTAHSAGETLLRFPMHSKEDVLQIKVNCQ